MKIIAILGVAFALTACGNTDTAPNKSQSEAVDDIRTAFDTDVPDSQIRQLLLDTCEMLDKYTPKDLVEQVNTPPAYTHTLMYNATAAFCTEHRAAYNDYMENLGH
jgi:hypothetical protein